MGERGELALVAAIRERVRPCGEGVVVGIGDDCSITRVEPGEVILTTTDLLIEDVHFRCRHDEPESLGGRALAVNVSDIAAMGGEPRHAWLGLAAPRTLTFDWVLRVVDGFLAAARDYGVVLVGGDTSASPSGLVLSITVSGSAPAAEVVRRSGARPGDAIVVSGSLGNSAAGLALLERGQSAGSAAERELLDAHLRPRAAVAVGRFAAASGVVTAMIDLSDGLATDLRHVVAESGGLGAVIHGEQVPISAALRTVCGELCLDPFDLAIGGGEDYRLLMTVAPEEVESFVARARYATGARLTVIGRVERTVGIRLLRDGRVTELSATGYQHWRD